MWSETSVRLFRFWSLLEYPSVQLNKGLVCLHWLTVLRTYMRQGQNSTAGVCVVMERCSISWLPPYSSAPHISRGNTGLRRPLAICPTLPPMLTGSGVPCLPPAPYGGVSRCREDFQVFLAVYVPSCCAMSSGHSPMLFAQVLGL